MLKIRGTEIQQALTELMMQAAGRWRSRRAVGDAATSTRSPRRSRRATATSARPRSTPGSNEIQRNIIAKMSLGL